MPIPGAVGGKGGHGVATLDPLITDTYSNFTNAKADLGRRVALTPRLRGLYRI